MPALPINATQDEIKAVELIVMDAQEWLQAAWDGKVENCLKRSILEFTDKNPNKMTGQERRDAVQALNVVRRRNR